MRRRRWRWIIAGAIVLIGALFAVDIVMVQYLESRGAAEIARTMSAEDATVELGGVPFIPRFLGGSLTDVSVRVRGATARGGLRVRSVEARMQEVHFDAGDLFALARSVFSTRTKIEAIEPVGLIELEERDLQEYLERSIPQVAHVRIRGSGVEVRFLRPGVEPADPANPRDDEMTQPARFLPRVENSKLRLSLTSVSQLSPIYRNDAERIETLINLPSVPEGMRSAVSLRNEVIVLEAQGAGVELMVGEKDIE